MESDICPICIEPITNNYQPYNCKHYYHEECVNQLNNSKCKEYKNNCSLCKAELKINIPKKKEYKNYVFNNFLDRPLNIQYYINKWSDKNCIDSNHKLVLETLGDWNMSKSREFTMDFRMMHINCLQCNKDQLVK